MVFDKIKEVLVEQLDLDPDKITRDTDLMTDLGVDSLDLVELIVALEDEYNLKDVDETAFADKNVGEIADYIETLIK